MLAAAVERSGRPAWRVALTEIPTAPAERDDWLRLVQREMLLDGIGLVVEVPTIRRRPPSRRSRG